MRPVPWAYKKRLEMIKKIYFFSNPLPLEDLLTKTVVVNWHLGHREKLEGKFLEHRSEVFVSS